MHQVKALLRGPANSLCVLTLRARRFGSMDKDKGGGVADSTVGVRRCATSNGGNQDL